MEIEFYSFFSKLCTNKSLSLIAFLLIRKKNLEYYHKLKRLSGNDTYYMIGIYT